MERTKIVVVESVETTIISFRQALLPANDKKNKRLKPPLPNMSF